ncbi:MAG: hypothetical protein ACI38Y_03870, partial [Candidatus Methanomethylophilaceae archaeon]
SVEYDGDEDAGSSEDIQSNMEFDGWNGLMMALDHRERDHLRALCTGGTECDPRLEDSINGKALDHIGDILVMDGTIVEEYRRDINRVIWKSMPVSDPYAELVSLLDKAEMDYLRIFVSGKTPRGRKPIMRIDSINGKARRTIGSDIIEHGTIAGKHIDGLRRAMDHDE